MERIPKAIYTKELREEAVKLVAEGGLKIPEVGRRLSIVPSTLRYWVKADREGKLKEVGKQQRPLTEIEMELVHIKVYRRAGDAEKVIRTSPQHSPLCGEPNCETATQSGFQY